MGEQYYFDLKDGYNVGDKVPIDNYAEDV